jgi:hypothetical protein
MHLQFVIWASGVKGFVYADFREHPIYPLLVLHQVLICFILIHGVVANHEIHSSFDFEHEIVGTLAVSQLKAEFRERNFLCCPVDIEVHDFGRGPTIRNRLNSSSGELLDNVATTEDGAREVEHIFAVPVPAARWL